MVLDELPRDLPSFLARFGTDAQCRAHLFARRWPEGFRCAGCGHVRAYSHHARLIEGKRPTKGAWAVGLGSGMLAPLA